jgi:hypothetical protein
MVSDAVHAHDDERLSAGSAGLGEQVAAGLDSNRGTDGYTHFSTDAARPISGRYIAWLVIASIAAVAMRYFPLSELDMQVEAGVLFYLVVLIVHIVRRIKQGGAPNALAPDILFVFVYSMFHVVYLLLWLVGVAEFSDFVFYSISSVPVSLAIVNLGLIGFLLGYELSGCSKRSRSRRAALLVPRHGWGMVGISMMSLGVLMHVGTLAGVGLDVFVAYGYTAVQRLDEFVGGLWPVIWSRSVQVFILGLTIYVIYSGLRYKKLFNSKAALGLTVIFLSLVIIEGDRGPMFLICIPLVIVRHYFIKSIKLRTVAVFLVTALAVFTVIRIVRGRAFSPGQMLGEFQQARRLGEVHWANIFTEMGSSYRISNMTASIVPATEGYWQGKSWLGAVAHIIPFLEGYFAEREYLEMAPSQWITLTIVGPDAGGLGFSLPTEGYLNFGLWGTLGQMMFFGVLIRRVTIWFSRCPSAFTAMVMVGILCPAIKVIRDHLSLVTPMFAQVFLLGILLNMCLGNEDEESFDELPQEEEAMIEH